MKSDNHEDTVRSTDKTALLRKLPGVDTLYNMPQLAEAVCLYGREGLHRAVNCVLDALRGAISSGDIDACPDIGNITDSILLQLQKERSYSMKRVINAVGVVLHTNLGRAVMSSQAAEHVREIAASYSNLEYNLDTGKRGSRNAHIEELMKQLWQCEGAMAVNNNAAAVLLALCAVSYKKNTIISRGELVEIGGSFRVPQIMEQSGTILKEVGTTNKTRIADYEEAVDSTTGALLKVHTSNFRIEGFTGQTSLQELVKLGEKSCLPVIYDLGSGSFFSGATLGIGNEPAISEVLRTGADIVCFSGDKLLGGPQAGIILGKKKYIELMKKHPLARVLRIDKLDIAALEATLQEYLDSDIAMKNIPALKTLSLSEKELAQRTELVREYIFGIRSLPAEDKEQQYGTLSIETVLEQSEVGGGALPGEKLTTVCLSIRSSLYNEDELARKLRSCEPPVIGRISEGRLLLDMRTVQENELRELAEAIISLDSGTTAG